MTEILIAAYQLADEIINSSDFIKLKTLNQRINQQYQTELTEFNRLKEAYQQILATGGSYHPDFKEIVKQLSKVKTKLYQTPMIAELLELETLLQERLTKLMKEVAVTISPYIKLPNEVGLFTKERTCK